MVERYAAWVVRNKWLVLIASIVCTLALASGGRFLSFTNDYRVFFSKENPQLIAFEETQDAYTKSDNVLIMIEPKDGDVFTQATLAAIMDLTERAWQIPNSIRVDSLTNYQHMIAEEDDLIVSDLVEDLDAVTASDLERFRTAALDQPTLVKKLLSPDSRATGVNITMELPEELNNEELAALTPEERAAHNPMKELEETVTFTRAMITDIQACLLYTSPSPRDRQKSRMPSSA